MGRNKYSNKEIDGIAKLLRLKNSANRAKQKELRHKLRVEYEFNISDFNVPGRSFGEQELYDAINRRAIVILDDKTIADMKAKRQRDREPMRLYANKKLCWRTDRLEGSYEAVGRLGSARNVEDRRLIVSSIFL